MWFLITFPFLLQAVVIGCDEGYFHLKRGLPKWERIGHPLDTLSVLACFLFALFVPYSPLTLKVYIALSIFSCLLVTKDEFVHKHHCPAAEQWLHALLFLNHPVLLASLGLLWPFLHGGTSMDWLSSWQQYTGPLQAFVLVQAGLTALFMLYQIIYWNFIWQEYTETT